MTYTALQLDFSASHGYNISVMRTFTLISASLLAICTSQGAVIAYYVDGTDADGLALANLVTNPGVTVSALSAVGFTGGTSITRPDFGVATPAGPTAGSSAGSEWLFARSKDTTGTGATVPGTAADYFGFTVTAGGTETLNLTTLRFDFVAVVDAAGTIEGKAQAFINVDGGGFNPIGSEFLATSTAGSGPTHFFGTVTQASVDLSSITGASSVEIRIGLADNRDEDGKATFVQGIQLDANIVPEPSTMIMGALGAALLLRRRRL